MKKRWKPVLVYEFWYKPETTFGRGGLLVGFAPMGAESYDGPRAKALFRALKASQEDEEMTLGTLPDGRWALVGLAVEGHRFAVERRIPDSPEEARLKRAAREFLMRRRARAWGGRGRTDKSCCVCWNTKVKLVEGGAPPVLEGLGYWKTGFNGPNGFHKTLYTPSTLHIVVGKDWKPEDSK